MTSGPAPVSHVLVAEEELQTILRRRGPGVPAAVFGWIQNHGMTLAVSPSCLALGVLRTALCVFLEYERESIPEPLRQWLGDNLVPVLFKNDTMQPI